MATGKSFFVMDSLEKMLTYGVPVYQVWSSEKVWSFEKGLVVWSLGSPDTLEYETSSKAKANAVCEYLKLKWEQEDIDKHRSPDVKGTIVPSSIKC